MDRQVILISAPRNLIKFFISFDNGSDNISREPCPLNSRSCPLPLPCPAATGVTKADIIRTTVSNIDTIRIFFFTKLSHSFKLFFFRRPFPFNLSLACDWKKLPSREEYITPPRLSIQILLILNNFTVQEELSLFANRQHNPVYRLFSPLPINLRTVLKAEHLFPVD